MKQVPPKTAASKRKNPVGVSQPEAISSEVEQAGRKESFETWNEAIERQSKELAEQSEASGRYGRWLARIALLPLALLLAGLVLNVLLGLWSGEIKEIAKYGRAVVLRGSNPIAFWLSVAYHSTLAAFVAWVSVGCLRVARLSRRDAT